MNFACALVLSLLLRRTERNPTRARIIFAAKVKNQFRCKMKRIALVLALAGTCTLGLGAPSPALALETYEAQVQATAAASQARLDMVDACGPKLLRPGQYPRRDGPEAA